MRKNLVAKLILTVLFVFLASLFTGNFAAVSAETKDKPESKVDEKKAEDPMAPPEGNRPPMPPKNDFMKNLTPEQREEAQKIMLANKARIDLADIYAESGKVDDAIAEIKKVLSAEMPSFIPAKEVEERKSMLSMKIVDLYFKAGKEEQALAEAENLISKGNLPVVKQGNLLTMIGHAYKKKGNNDKAAEYLKKAIEILEKK